MALLTLQTVSEQLQMTTVVYMIVPDVSRAKTASSERKVLYLLHGLSDNASMWVRRSMLENYAEKYGITVVMPSADRSFYFDGVLGQNYFSYISQELPQYLNKLMGLPLDRNSNFIAGQSMGGYGAMKIALSCPDRYFACGSFSGLIAFDIFAGREEEAFKRLPFFKGRTEEFLHGKDNVPNLLCDVKGKNLDIYVSCGLSDDLLYASKIFEKRAAECGVAIRTNYTQGGHDWNFWDGELKNFLSFALEK